MTQTEKLYPYMFAESENRNEHIKLAWEKAEMAVAILKKEFGAKRVILFGSLANTENFDNNSDIDLAVEGIDESVFYKALGRVISEIDDFEFDIVDCNDCSKVLLNAINKEGIEL